MRDLPARQPTHAHRAQPEAQPRAQAARALQGLQSLPNVGPAVARMLVRLGIADQADLRGQDPELLFERLCALDGRRHDPCLLDTFTAVVDHADGAPARPWWHYSRLRKAAATTVTPASRR